MNPATERMQRLALWVACSSAVAPVVSIAASHILLGAALAMMLVARSRPVWTPAWPPLLFFMGWSLLSLAASGDVWAGLPQVRKFYVLAALVVLATLVRRLEPIRSVVWGWAAAGAASSLWAGIQFYGKWRRSSGGDFYLDYVADRVTGFMSHWMTFSGVVMIALLFVLAHLLFARRSRKERYLLAAAVAVMSVGLVLGWTRSVWLGCLCGAAYLIWNWRKLAILALPAALGLGFVMAPPSLKQRAVSVLRPHGERDSNQHRAVTRGIGWQMIKAHPWFGVGPEQVARQYKKYLPPGTAQIPDGFYGHLHNIYFQFAAERGVPALVALLWCVLASAVLFLRALGRRPPPAETAILHGAVAVTVAILATGYFEHNLGDSEVLQLYLTVLAFGFTAAQRA
jgi:putative inorganic carbon (HCO3(-)) transporter